MPFVELTPLLRQGFERQDRFHHYSLCSWIGEAFEMGFLCAPALEGLNVNSHGWNPWFKWEPIFHRRIEWMVWRAWQCWGGNSANVFNKKWYFCFFLMNWTQQWVTDDRWPIVKLCFTDRWWMTDARCALTVKLKRNSPVIGPVSPNSHLTKNYSRYSLSLFLSLRLQKFGDKTRWDFDAKSTQQRYR